MGQAAVDLPDPLEPNPSGTDASADDLLAQLAGDEIDRLLAEANTPRGGALGEPPPASSPAAPLAEIALPPAPPASTAADLDSVLSSQLDALFDQLSAPLPEEAALTATGSISTDSPDFGTSAPAEAQAVPVAEIAVAPLPVPATHEEAPGLLSQVRPEAEAVSPPADVCDVVRSGLNDERQTMSTALAEAMVPDERSQPLEEPPAPSIPVRILEWMNAPLSRCSDAVRETVGKVAIITLFNALAVLLYVLIFRR